ncbi:MAG: hypothetical protein IKC24_03855 [Oscillospiraceae bacterium]|nr:hypothetical protein [Oscillospiraceae bacterium]
MASVLDMLSRELETLETRRTALLQELESLPRGYVSKKEIKGRDYFYLQHREGQQIKSQLIKQGALESVLESIRRKKQLKQEIREIEREQKQIQRMLKKEQRKPLFAILQEKNT